MPYGTLDKYEAARYEQSTYSTSLFHGYYIVSSNFPLTVHMGQGDEGSNPIINDWFPGVGQLGSGLETRFVIGGVEGASGGVEGKYWIQAHEDDTEVYVWISSEAAEDPSLWRFYNSTTTPLNSWPAVLDAGEYISKINMNWQTILMVNATKPVSWRAGDEDASYARDIQGF